MSSCFISTDNARESNAIMEILDHYFVNYDMKIQENQDRQIEYVVHSYAYRFKFETDKETEKKIHNDIAELKRPATLRRAADGSDYLERITMHR